MSDHQPPPPPEQPPPPPNYPPPPPNYPPPASYQQQPPTTAGQPGDLGSRFLARIIDGVLVGVVFAVVFGIFGVMFAIAGGSGSYAFSVLSTIASTALALGYYAYLESSRGQTIGKMLLKLRVQTLDGQNPTMEQAIKRNSWIALSLIGILPILGGFIAGLASLAAVIYIAVTINSDTAARRGWHDQFGGTRVVKTA